MLMRFSISNYMSFDYKEDSDNNICTNQFHLYAGSSQQFRDRVVTINNRNILKFSSLYGANASGKTNLIKAIDCGKHIIISTMEYNNLSNKYCKTHKENIDKPSLFEYELFIDVRCYAYGFTVILSQNIVLSEWLYELNGNIETTIFERVTQNNEYYFNEDYFSDYDNIKEFNYYIKDANRISKSLLLYELDRRNLNHKDFEVFSSVFNWFKYNLIVIYPDTKIGTSYFHFCNDNKDLSKLLYYFDTGITDYKMQSINKSAFREYFSDSSVADKFLQNTITKTNENFKSILCYGNTLFELNYKKDSDVEISKLLFNHSNDDNYYKYGEESDGTKRLVELLDVIFNNNDKTFIIDELDRSLHPQMTRKFVETFINFSKNINKQLIITTHESNLMDLELLRRDEIWFAEKENTNSTTLYTLEEFKVRYDKVISKNYLAGRYGAVPVFKDFDYIGVGNESEKTKFKNT